MKIALFIVGGLIIIGLGAFFLLGENDNNDNAKPETQLNAMDIVYKQAIDEISTQDAVLLDVRTPEEYSQLHAVGSTLFEVTRLDNGELPRYPANQKIYVYCRSGNRSASAVDTLRKAGFTDVFDLGALADWQAAGGPVQSS